MSSTDSPRWKTARPIRRRLADRTCAGLVPLALASKALATAMRAKKAVQGRIVASYRRQLAGDGRGPADSDLQLFARIAVAEQRLRRQARRLGPCRVQAHTQRWTNGGRA